MINYGTFFIKPGKEFLLAFISPDRYNYSNVVEIVKIAIQIRAMIEGHS
jgi:hypothetical protein